MIYQEENSASNTGIDRRYYLNFEFTPHIHANPEFIYVVSGSLTATIDGRVMDIPQDSFCIVLPWQMHSFATREYSRSVVIVAAERYLGSFVRDTTACRGETQVFRADSGIRDLFLKHMCGDDLPDEYMTSCVLMGLCHCFVSECPLAPAADRYKTTVMQEMMSYVGNHCHEAFTLHDVADELGYSYYHLSHVFREYAGVNFRQFCNMRRIERARQRLETSSAAITDIAFECGFTNIRSFNRVFRDIAGTSPGEYRARNSAIVNGERLSIRSGMNQSDGGIAPRTPPAKDAAGRI